MRFIAFLITSCLFMLVFTSFYPPIETRTILEKMLNAVQQLRTVQYQIHSQERLKDETNLTDATSLTKVMESPTRKFYIQVLSEANKGTELLYVQGENNNKVKVAKSWLPNVNLSLFSSFLTNGQRHTVKSVGFLPVLRIIGEGIKRSDIAKNFNSCFFYRGEIIYKNKKCFKIEIIDPAYSFSKYQALKGETPYSIAFKFGLSEYAIVEKNKLSYFDDEVENKIIFIPSSYAKNSVFYIDEATYLPVYQEISDDRGLFEKYEFYNVLVNPVFSTIDFSADNPNYHF